MLRRSLPLLGSALASAMSPAPSDAAAAEADNHPSFTRFISLIASESFSAGPVHHPAIASGHLGHMGHVATSWAVLSATHVVESVPSYLIACIMVLCAVLVFGLFWCAFAHRVAAWRPSPARDPHAGASREPCTPPSHPRRSSSLARRVCTYCLCLVGAERRAKQAATKRKKHGRLT